MTEGYRSPPLGARLPAENYSQHVVVGFDALGETTHPLTKALALASLIPHSHVEIVWAPPTSYAPSKRFLNRPPEDILEARVGQVVSDFGVETLARTFTTVSAVVGEGRPAQAIRRIAFEHDADLIIVGSPEAATSLEQVLSGSVPKRLIEEAPCPVLVVRSRSVGDERGPDKPPSS